MECPFCSSKLHILTKLDSLGIKPTGYLECPKCLSLFNAITGNIVTNNYKYPKQEKKVLYG